MNSENLEFPSAADKNAILQPEDSITVPFCFVLFCFRYIEHIIDNEWCSGYVVTVLAKIKRFMNGNWQVTIFYDYPLEIVSHWNAVLVSHNKFSK